MKKVMLVFGMRPEGIATGTLKPVGTDEANNPYGDSRACERIADVLCGRKKEEPEQ